MATRGVTAAATCLRTIGSILLVAMTVATSTARATGFEDRFYVGPDAGLWSDPANWSATSGGAGGAGVPVAGDRVFLDNATAATVSATLDVNYAGPELALLSLDGTNGFVNTVSQTHLSAFNMAALAQFIGNTGSGRYIQSTGQNTASTEFAVGTAASSQGTYELSGGSLSVLRDAEIGRSGVGTFLQTGGHNTVSGLMVLANLSGSSGRYDLSGGMLSAGGTSIGPSGTGVFTQSGGVQNIDVSTVIGGLPGSIGTFNHSAGSNTIGSHLILGGAAASGSLAAARGIYNLSGSAVMTAGLEEYIGDFGHGTFNHDGGVHNAPVGINLGSILGAEGRYFLNDGTINAGGMVIGSNGLGEFNKNAGSLFVDFNVVVGRFPGSVGTFNHSAGPTTIDGNLTVGPGGVLNMSGGTIITNGDIKAGSFTIAAGVINLSGGFLFTNYIFNQGTFNHSGGTYSGTLVGSGVYNFIPPPPGDGAEGTETVLSAASITIGSTGSGAANWSGGDIIVRAASTLTNQGTFNISSNSSIDGPAAGAGTIINRATLRKTSTGSTTFGQNLSFVSDNGVVDVQAGLLSVNGPFSTTSGSTLTKSGAGVMQISGPQNWGAGAVLQATGGTTRFASNVVAPTLDIGITATGAVEFNTPRSIVELVTMSDSGFAQLTPGANRVLVANNLTIELADDCRLDMTDNDMIIDYGTGMGQLDQMTGYVRMGYANGAWTGNGIISSIADFQTGTHGIGLAEASAIFTNFPAPFAGELVDNTSVLLSFTHYGDANLDGAVNLNDFNRLAANFGGSGKYWSDGDFNYDGLVNLTDFNRLASNFGLSAGPNGPTPQDWAALASALPEPSAAGSAALLAILLRRRRDQR